MRRRGSGQKPVRPSHSSEGPESPGDRRGQAPRVAAYTYDPAQTAGVEQLTSVSEDGQTTTFAYNPDGETVQRGADSLSWDGWGRHTGGTFNGTTVSYSFDPAGFRRQRTAAGQTTRYLLAGLYETDATDTPTLTDIDGPAGDLAHYAGPPSLPVTISYLYDSGHGDLAAEADDSGARTAAYSYDPYGALTSGTATGAAERWTGRWDKKHDAASGLIEMGARPYDPTLGRFLSVDPIDGGSLNNYDYAGQDPINSFDLDGLRIAPLIDEPIGFASGGVRTPPKQPKGSQSKHQEKSPGHTSQAINSVTFSRQGGMAHGARHLKGTGLSAARVESAIAKSIRDSSRSVTFSGDF